MHNNHTPLPILDISLTDRIGMLMEKDPSIAQALQKTDIRYREEFTEIIEKLSQSLGYSRKDVLEGICLYYAEKRKTRMAITYANIYVNETDVNADNLAHIF